MGIKLVVEEMGGIRRFLYPMKVRLPAIYRRSIGKLAVAEADGRLVPSHVADTPTGVQCAFALSMAPFETRELNLVLAGSAPLATIPDPLMIEASEDGLVSKQDRVSFGIARMGLLRSVVYDSTEHLAGPLSITLDGAPMAASGDGLPIGLQSPVSNLSAEFGVAGEYTDLRPAKVSGETEIELTCCKSWIEVRHAVLNPQPNSVLRFCLPLTVTSSIQTCDFGVGNGIYGKTQAGMAERVVWETDLSQASIARYRVRTQLPSGELRTDFAGELRGPAEIDSRLWLHWNEPTKALALAITRVSSGCERIAVRLGADGVIESEFLLGRTIANPAQFGICYHFLNNIPPIAAATNPASILAKPKVAIVRAVS